MNNINGDVMMDQFIDQLVKETGMEEKLEASTLEGIKKDLKDRLENRIKAMILSQIPADKLDEFEKLLGSGDEKATQNFCNETIPDFPELLAAEFLNFRNRYIAA
jgi:hypothetical protein